MSEVALVSPPTRFDAYDEKATKRPSLDSDGHELLPLALPPLRLTETRWVVPDAATALGAITSPTSSDHAPTTLIRLATDIGRDRTTLSSEQGAESLPSGS